MVNQTSNDTKIIKTKIVTVNIDKLCESICLAAERFYKEKDPILFKDHKINFIDFNSFKNQVKDFDNWSSAIGRDCGKERSFLMQN